MRHCPRHHMTMTTTTQSISARSSPGTRTPPSVAGHQDGGEKYGTDGPKSQRARNITIGTWNVRSLRAAGKVEELAHEMKRYRWKILGLCEVRWKNGVGFLIQKDCECHDGMQTSLQPTHYHSSEVITV